MFLQRSAVFSTVPPPAVDAAQNTTGLLAYKSLLLDHVQLHARKALRTFPAAQPPAGTGAWVVPPHMQGLVLSFLELLKVPCQPAEVALEGSTALLPAL